MRKLIVGLALLSACSASVQTGTRSVVVVVAEKTYLPAEVYYTDCTLDCISGDLLEVHGTPDRYVLTDFRGCQWHVPKGLFDAVRIGDEFESNWLSDCQ